MKAGDPEEGKALVGLNIRIPDFDGAEGVISDARKGRFVVEMKDGSELKTKLEEGFVYCDMDYVKVTAAPTVQSALEQWSNQKLNEIDAEKKEIDAQLEVEQEKNLEEYLRDNARKNLEDAASAANYWASVQAEAYKNFCIDFQPTCDAMDPELIEDAGGVTAVLENTWVSLDRKDRAIFEDAVPETARHSSDRCWT